MSSHDLFHLLNQLQTVEKALINILMEAAIKISSLTESNIFVLVETPEERKFGGSATLCQGYVEAGLRHRENDVKLDVDPTRCDVAELRGVVAELRSNDTYGQFFFTVHQTIRYGDLNLCARSSEAQLYYTIM